MRDKFWNKINHGELGSFGSWYYRCCIEEKRTVKDRKTKKDYKEQNITKLTTSTINVTFCNFHYVARVRFGIRVRVRVRVRDLAIFEKGGCGCGGPRRLKNIFIYIFNILLSIFFHIIQTYTKFKSNSR